MSGDPATLMRRWMEEVWNQGKDGTIDELFHPQGIAHGLTDEAGKQLVGPEGFRVFYRRFASAFSGMHIEVVDSFSSGEKGVVRFVFTGKHTGDGLGVPATGRSVRATGMTIAHFADGKMMHGWNEFDSSALMQQVAPAVVGRTQVMA